MQNHQPVISKIELKNFKCHSSFCEDFNNLTILAGENSAGKSSIIQSLLLFDTATHSAEDSVFTLNVRGINLGNASGIITESSGSDKTEITLHINNQPNHLQLAVAEDNDVSFKVSRNHTKEKLHNLFYINAERLGPRAVNSISSQNPFDVGTHGENAVYIVNQLDSIIKKLDFVYKEGKDKWQHFSEITKFSAIVEECLQRIIPGTKLRVKTNAEQGTSAIRYSNGYGADVIPTATGFGITYVLPIIVQSLVSLLFSDAVLIVENPEAHLHPYSQSQLGRFLAEISALGTQLIIETHSEHIINGCRLRLAETEQFDIARIIFFSRNNDTPENKYDVIKIDRAGELSAWPKGFFDQSEHDLLEVIKNKCKL